MKDFFIKHKYQLLLWFFILIYIVYFSYFSILRYKTLYASYYDLGIMNQTVYNTYRSITEKDFSRFLELTDPQSESQIKRMAIHNDLLLASIAPFYFIHAGPETLLVIQTVILALGALAVFGIAKLVIGSQFSVLSSRLSVGGSRSADLFGLVMALCYLLYPAMQRANIFDFHPVTLATTLILFMFYFWLVKKYCLSFLFFILSLLTKEQVGLTTMMFGIFTLLRFISKQQLGNANFSRENLTPTYVGVPSKVKNLLLPRYNNINVDKNFKQYFSLIDKELFFLLLIIEMSLIWVLFSFLVIIPYFRGSEHFAVVRYGDFGDSPLRIIIGIIKQPYSLVKYIFHIDTLRYFIFLLGPLAFFSLLSPLYLFVALPEFVINLLSNNWNMRSIIYHYTAVIQPWMFISGIYGIYYLYNLKVKRQKSKVAIQNLKFIIIIPLIFSILFSYFKGPLPFAREQEIHPFKYPQKAMKEVALWAKTLQDEKIKISASGQVAPHFSSRRYLYQFSQYYYLADYIVIRPDEIYNYPEKESLIPIYEKLIKDDRFERIYKSKELEVYKKSQMTNDKSQINNKYKY